MLERAATSIRSLQEENVRMKQVIEELEVAKGGALAELDRTNKQLAATQTSLSDAIKRYVRLHCAPRVSTGRVRADTEHATKCEIEDTLEQERQELKDLEEALTAAAAQRSGQSPTSDLAVQGWLEKRSKSAADSQLEQLLAQVIRPLVCMICET